MGEVVNDVSAAEADEAFCRSAASAHVQASAAGPAAPGLAPGRDPSSADRAGALLRLARLGRDDVLARHLSPDPATDDPCTYVVLAYEAGNTTAVRTDVHPSSSAAVLAMAGDDGGADALELTVVTSGAASWVPLRRDGAVLQHDVPPRALVVGSDRVAAAARSAWESTLRGWAAWYGLDDAATTPTPDAPMLRAAVARGVAEQVAPLVDAVAGLVDEVAALRRAVDVAGGGRDEALTEPAAPGLWPVRHQRGVSSRPGRVTNVSHASVTHDEEDHHGLERR